MLGLGWLLRFPLNSFVLLSIRPKQLPSIFSFSMLVSSQTAWSLPAHRHVIQKNENNNIDDGEQ